MRFFQFAALIVALASAGCALRPRYADFINAKTAGKEVTFVVIDTDTSRPVPGAKVEVSELKNRITVTTAADGTFKLPVDQKYVTENPVFVVTLPATSTHYRIDLVPVAPPQMPVTPMEPTPEPAAPVAPAVEAVDAGVPANG